MSEPGREASLYACLDQPAFAPGTFSASAGQAHHRTACTTNAQRPTPKTLSSPSRPEFSPRYEQHRAGLVSIDVRGLSRLLGTPRTIGEELRREAASRGVRVHVAIAPTRMAALVLSLVRPGLTVVDSGRRGRGARAHRPARARATARGAVAGRRQLDTGASARGRGARGDGRAEALGVAHARRTGGVAARRSVGAARTRRTCVAGDRAWRRPAAARADAGGGALRGVARTRVANREGWSRCRSCSRGCSSRCPRVSSGATAAPQCCTCSLGSLRARCTRAGSQLPSPLRDVRTLRTLALLDFDSHPPSAAIDRVTVTIEPTPGRVLQHALFARPHPTPEQLSTLLARLGALMGQDRVGAPALVDTHRPGAFAMAPFAIRARGPSQSPVVSLKSQAEGGAPIPDPRSLFPAPLPVSVVRRWRQPIPARVAMDSVRRPLRVSTDRRGFAGGAVLSCAGPWRTSGAWWEEGEEGSHKSQVTSHKSPPRAQSRSQGGPWSRDEWDVALDDGAVYRVFRDRVTDGWFIDGVLD